MLPYYIASEAFCLTSVLLPIIASAAITNPTVNILQPTVEDSSVSALPSSPVDPRFRKEIAGYNHIPVSRTSLMMTFVNEMSKLALLDWNGQVGSFRSTPFPGYSDVAIFLNVKSPARTIQTRIAVWGLFSAFVNTAVANRFKACDVDLYWADVKVARIRIRPNPATSSQSTIGEQGSMNQSLVQVLPTLPRLDDAINNLSNGSPNLTNGTSTLTEPVFEADCGYLEDAETLTDIEVFATVFSVLRNLAPVPKTNLVDEGFETGMRTVEAKIQFQGPGEIPSHAPGPPYYQYQWVIRAVHAMPIYMLHQRRFAELGVGIVVDGRRLGRGQILKGEMGSRGVAGTNVSNF